MYKRCHSEQSSLRQQEIAEVFLCLLRDTSMEQLRISALCRAAGISRKVFYRYFDAKEDVLCFLADELYAEFRLRFPALLPFRAAPGPEDCAACFRFWGERRALLTLLLDRRYTAFFREHLLRRLREEYPTLSALAERDWTVSASGAYLFGGFLGLLRFWSDSGFRQPPEELGALLSRLLVPGADG